MKSTLTPKQESDIRNLIADMELPVGKGSKEAACSIAAINLALSGELTDKVPECMSEIIGRWIIIVQDEMPAAMRNSQRWKSLLPRAAGTGRKNEAERLAIIMEWMWSVALPYHQEIADRLGYGKEWKAMCETRTAEAAVRAAEAAARAARAAGAAEAAGAAAEAAARAAAWAAWAAGAAAWAAWAAGAAAGAAEAAGAAAEAAAEAWERFDPCTLLERLIEVDRS